MSTIAFTDLAGVLTAVAIQLGIALTCLAVFTYYLAPRYPNVYEAKATRGTQSSRPPALSSQNASWISFLGGMKEKELISYMGLDAFFLLDFVGLSMKLFAMLSLFAVPLILLNYFAPNFDQKGMVIGPNNVTLSLTLLSMANVPTTSNLFYAHTIAAYLFSAIALYLLQTNFTKYYKLRAEFINSEEYQSRFYNRILLITDNIKNLQDSQRFQAYLGSLKLELVPIEIRIGRDLKKLPELLKKHLATTIKFEKVLATYFKDGQPGAKRPTHNEGAFLGIVGGNKVDSILFYKTELDKIEKEIFGLRAKPESDFETDTSCFVQFGSVQERTYGGRDMRRKGIHAKNCPDFDDIIWENIGQSFALKKSRKVTAVLLTIALIVGWVTLQSAIAALSGSLITNSGLPASVIVFLQSILTPLINVVLNILLPVFLREIAKLQNVVSFSGVERSATYKFFTFQVYQYITQLAAAVVFSFAGKLISGQGIGDIQEVTTKLSTALVQQSTYFITFIVTGLSGFGINMLQIAPLVVTPLMKRFLATTPRDKKSFDDIQEFDFLATYGFILMTFLLGLSYSVVAPLIVLFVTLVFSIAFVTLRYLLVYVYKSKTETGGAWVPKVFNMCISCLVIFQFSTLGAVLFLSRDASPSTRLACSILIFILIGMTLIYWAWICLQLGSSFSCPSARSCKHHALCSPLDRVWVDAALQEAVKSVYEPEFTDVVEFVKRTKLDPKEWDAIEALEERRKVQRDTMDPLASEEDSNSTNVNPTPLAGSPAPSLRDVSSSKDQRPPSIVAV